MAKANTNQQTDNSYFVNPNCPLCSGMMFLQIPDFDAITERSLWHDIVINYIDIPVKAVYCHLCFPQGIAIDKKKVLNFRQAYNKHCFDESYLNLFILVARLFHCRLHGISEVDKRLANYGIPALLGEYTFEWINARQSNNKLVNAHSFVRNVINRLAEGLRCLLYMIMSNLKAQ